MLDSIYHMTLKIFCNPVFGVKVSRLCHVQSCLHSSLRPPDKSAKLKIIFLISQPKHMLWVLKRIDRDGSFEHQNTCLN